MWVSGSSGCSLPIGRSRSSGITSSLSQLDRIHARHSPDALRQHQPRLRQGPIWRQLALWCRPRAVLLSGSLRSSTALGASPGLLRLEIFCRTSEEAEWLGAPERPLEPHWKVMGERLADGFSAEPARPPQLAPRK